MKIGILVWQLDVKGGTQRQALELAQYLSKTEHKVVVYAYLHDREKCYSELCDGLDIRYVKLNRDADISDYPRTHLQFFVKYFLFFLGVKHRELLRIIDSDVDILNPHDCGTYVTAGLWKKKYKKPAVWMMNDLPLYKWDINYISKTIGYYTRPRYRRYIQDFEKIIVLDNLNKAGVQKNFNKQSVVVRSGIDINRFSFAERTNNKKRKIFMISVLFPHRRIEDAVRALRHLIDWGYDVDIEHVGSTNLSPGYFKKICKSIKRLGVENHFKFHGAVSSEKLSEFFEKFDFYLFPNSPQTWGLSVFESMASGMPVVITSGCGASEILTNEENTIITEPYSPMQIARAIARLINEPEWANNLARSAREFVENNLSWERYSREMFEQIKETYRQ